MGRKQREQRPSGLLSPLPQRGGGGQAHELVAAYKESPRFPEIARRAAQLAKAGESAEAILAAVAAEFGKAAEIARLRDDARPLRIYGEVGADIDAAAVAQIELALRLPIAVRGALMPDAHVGYALPIGGVFAAHNAVSPAMVGVDIGCRMHLSAYPEPPEELLRQRTPLLADLHAVTRFGVGAKRVRPADHAILDDPRWEATSITHSLRAKGAEQLGTSGAGNHFAELVVGEVLDPEALPDFPARFSALLTHSGSRGLGSSIASHFGRVATQETARKARVPRMYEWLDLDSQPGQDYWTAMELAGAFAKANHEVIHAAFARRSGLKPVAVVQNHHNFAWRVGDLVVHRKGATPAGAGTLGIIPGSMGTASYIVVGLGNEEGLQSASHGAGRRASRRQAKESIALHQVREWLAERNILVDGLSADESPQAYKDIERVLELQVRAALIRPVARMHPVAVIMAGGVGED
ncbi:MAG: RtcB family protein [Chloroflexi bacterium]|nr:RtcB family protein [Chloroflexota bacterium]